MKYWQMFVDAWRMFRTYVNKQKPWGDEFYHGLSEDARKLNDKYRSKLFRQLAVAVMDEIERMDKNAK